MKRFIKKSVSLILAAMLVCTLPGMTAAAEETDLTVTAQEEPDILKTDNQEEETENPDAGTEEGTENPDAGTEEGTEDPDAGTEEGTKNPDAGTGEDEKTDPEEEEEPEDLDVFEEYEVDASIFYDVDETDWFCPYVSFVMNKGIMKGAGNNNFAPYREITRAEFAVIVYRLAGSPEVEYDGRFPDVAEGAYYADAVTWASQEEVGIVLGNAEGKFMPSNMITREDLAVMLYRFAVYSDFKDIEKSAKLDTFIDADKVSDYALDAVKWAVGVGIIKGGNKGDLDPLGNTNRAAAATMIMRFCNKYLSGQFENVDFTASCSSVSAEVVSNVQGTFKITVTDPQASAGISNVQATVYSKADKSDAFVYYLEPQENGTYQVTASVIHHNFNFGKYTIEAGILLSNGVRIEVGTETLALEGKIASCDSVTAAISDSKLGTFKVTVKNPYAVLPITKIQMTAYTKSNKSDKYTYNMSLQSNGTYQATANPKYHSYSFGTYTVEVNATLSNGMVITIGKTTINVSGKAATAQIYEYVYQVYNSVGRDLNKCYWWVVNNMSYQTLTVHVTPPSGYTRRENYALYGFKNKKGNCYVYAAMFSYLAEGLGYSCAYIEGQVGMAGGGYGPHGWVAVYMNGSTYICDPEAQDEPNLSKYNFYMQPKSNPRLRYLWP